MNCGDSIRVVHPLFQEEDDGSIPVSPLQFNFGRIDYKTAANLCDLWHSSMPYIGSASVCSPCYGAEYKNTFYAIAMWSLPIAANRIVDGNKLLELRRMAISDDAPRNTASKMLSWMRKDIKKIRPDIIRLISYQDTGAHHGTIYKASNWVIERESEYISWDKHRTRPGQLEQSTANKIRWGITT